MQVKAYRLIALLNITGKILKTIIIIKLSSIAKTYNLLLGA